MSRYPSHAVRVCVKLEQHHQHDTIRYREWMVSMIIYRPIEMMAMQQTIIGLTLTLSNKMFGRAIAVPLSQPQGGPRVHRDPLPQSR